jgi:hypothetical protein
LFLVSLELGFRMAEYLAGFPAGEKPGRILAHTIVPAALLGMTTSIRILGPLAAILVGIYFLLLKKPSRLGWLIPYAVIALLVMYMMWPYLWPAPVQNFLATLRFMADNPTQLRVLFYGKIYRADNLPIRYLPALLVFTLTEPVWPLALAGGIAALSRTLRKSIEWRSLLPTVLWFAAPLLYVILARPPLYDGFRHFMFIVPPLFLLAGLAIEALFDWLRRPLLRSAVIAVLLAPGLMGYLQLHPYEYTYYNRFVGGTQQAASRFETDYWLTCYKDAMQQINKLAALNPTVFVPRESYIADYYAAPGVKVVDWESSGGGPQHGEYVLESSRANPLIQKYVNNPNMIVIKRQGAVFCTITLNTR